MRFYPFGVEGVQIEFENDLKFSENLLQVKLHKLCKNHDYLCNDVCVEALLFGAFLSKFKKSIAFGHFFWQFLPSTFCKNYPKHVKFLENLGFVKSYTRIMIIVQFLYLWRSSKETFFLKFFSIFNSNLPTADGLLEKIGCDPVLRQFSGKFQKPKWFLQ